MSRRPVQQLIEDILERIGRIRRFTEGSHRDAFLQDLKTTDSVVRNLEVIGEAASRLPAPFRELHADIPWNQVIGLRNRIVHAYFDVDLEIVWEIVEVELPLLEQRLKSLLQSPLPGW